LNNFLFLVSKPHCSELFLLKFDFVFFLTPKFARDGHKSM
jgi:hypothetical protein